MRAGADSPLKHALSSSARATRRRLLSRTRAAFYGIERKHGAGRGCLRTAACQPRRWRVPVRGARRGYLSVVITLASTGASG